MALFAKTPDKILDEAIAFSRANTSLTAESPGSKFRTLIEILKTQLGDAYTTFDANQAITMIYGARGRYLDYLGEMFRVFRQHSSLASIDSTYENIKFYVKNGSAFGTINSNQSITVPSGTKLWGTKDGLKIEFITIQDVLLGRLDTEAYVSAKALRNGASSNLPASSLINHDFVDYTDYLNNSLSVINIDSIDNGSDLESDENYRFRILNSRLQDLSANKTAIMMAALSVNGVADVEILDKHFGIGTSAVLIKSTTPVVSDTLINQVQVALDAIKGEGVDVIAIKPRYIYMKFSFTLNTKAGLTAEQISAVQNNISLTVANTINNYDIGEGFSLTNLVSAILLSDSNIKSLGTSSKLIDSIYIIKTTPNGNYITNQIYGDYNIDQFTKLIISTDSDAVRFN